MHTRWSDGEGEIEDMAQEGIRRGYRYIAITDHTKGLAIAGGLNETELAKQGRRIDALNKDFRKQEAGFVILKSAEVNLSTEGEPDMSAAALRKLDIVLGAFHSSLRRLDDQTHRYLAALRHPGIHILGHPQTRIYNLRVGLKADWPRVFAEAARLDKAVEIDGYADRQDLRLSLLKIAKREGCRISLGTDSHRPMQMDFMCFSLAAAALAKISPDRILNFMTAEDLKTWAASVR
jgi:histidinol phosphatase-like PHP family hydrolase